jgi:protein-L-isoaspartate(D-aspartate) O-methyltransferase
VENDHYNKQRQAMVKDQLVDRGLADDRALDAMRKVPRHRFVPLESQADSYFDGPLPIGYGQTISQPYMVALMVQALELNGKEKVLEIGTGSGYQTAILAELCARVVSIERVRELAVQARQLLSDLQYDNITVIEADGTLGYQEEAPFDGIIVSAASPGVPDNLVRQLAENGRLVIPTGSRSIQELQVITKQKGKVKTRHVCGCMFVPLIGKEGWDE